VTSAVREPVSKLDNAWWHMESPVNHMVVTSVLLFDRPLDVAAVRALFEERLLRFPRFRQRIVTPARTLREPRWEIDPDFDIDTHLHHVALPPPGDDLALQSMVSDIVAVPLDPERPLWAAWVVDGYGTGGALISRLHHCIADGIALTRVLLSLTDEDPDDARTGEPEWWEARPRRTAGAPQHRGVAGAATHMARLAAHEGWLSVRHPAHARQRAAEGLSGARALARVTFLPTEEPTSLRGQLGLRKAVAWSEPIPLAEVKRVAAAVHGTVNDVLVAAVTGGLRTQLLARGDDVPGWLELHATVPVNLRALDGPIELGNRFGLVYPALPVGIRDPLQRLQAVKANMDRLKATPEALVAVTVLDALGHAPSAVERMFIALFTSKSTMVLTNVPGPRHRRLFAGVAMRRCVSWAPPSGTLPMSVSIFSYAGAITIGVLTDAHTVAEPQGLVDSIRAELGVLRRAGRRAQSR